MIDLNPLSLVFIALAIFISATLVLILHKVRLIHIATYRTLEDLSSVHKEAHLLFGQLQSLMALEKKLGLAEALPPMRGWAGSPDFLLALADEVSRRKPNVLVECSSGVSTVVAARCVQLNGSGHVYSLEHEPEFASKTRALLDKHGLTEWATVLVSPLQTSRTSTPWYDESVLPGEMGPINMLVVDGPPTSVAPLARAPALPRLQARMASAYVVLADDADRPDELEMVRQWRALVPGLKESRPQCEKGLAILEFVN